jgi:hypothetical protein
MLTSDAITSVSLDSSDLSPQLAAKPTTTSVSRDGTDEQSPPPRVLLDYLKSVSKDTPSTCASSHDGSASPVAPTVNESIEFSRPDAPVCNGPPYLQRKAPAKAPAPVRVVPKAFQPKVVRRKLPIGVLPGEFHRDDSASGAWRIQHSDDPDLFQNPGTRYSSKLGKGTHAR